MTVSKRLTKEECIAIAKNYTSRTELRRDFQYVHDKLYRLGILSEILPPEKREKVQYQTTGNLNLPRIANIMKTWMKEENKSFEKLATEVKLFGPIRAAVKELL